MKQPIKQAVCDLYHDIALSNKEIEQLRSLEGKPSSQILTIKRVAMSLCAVVVLAITALWLPSHNSANQIDTIVADAVDNHLLHKALEHKTHSLLDLADTFSYLGFAPMKSSLVNGLGQLMGARPCFILGVPAAQLRYQPSDTSWITVFQTRYQKAIYGTLPDQHKPLTKTNRGVQVSIWVEQDILFVTVATPSDFLI